MKEITVLSCCLLLLLLLCCACGLNTPISHSSSSSLQDQTSSIEESSASSSPSESSSRTSVFVSSSSRSSSSTSVSSSAIDMATLPAWKTLYIGNAQVFSKDYTQFALIYVDGDDIPELYMGGTSKNMIYSMSRIDEHAAISKQLDAQNTAYYIPKSGKLMNAFIDGDRLTMAIYQLDGYFQPVFQGSEYKVILNDGSQSNLYYLNGNSSPVSEDTFKAAVAQHFDTDRAVKMSDHFMSLEELKTAILNW